VRPFLFSEGETEDQMRPPKKSGDHYYSWNPTLPVEFPEHTLNHMSISTPHEELSHILNVSAREEKRRNKALF
jgi:hypothetical protein